MPRDTFALTTPSPGEWADAEFKARRRRLAERWAKLLESFEALDDWLRRGGRPPAAWTPETPPPRPPTAGELADLLLRLPPDTPVHLDDESFEASGAFGAYVSLSAALGELEANRDDAEEAGVPDEGDTFVLDPVELVAWGPFASDEDAERFVASEKYLESWCVLTSRRAVRRHRIPARPPAAYHGTWPKED